MATAAQIQSYNARIYKAATAGTPKNTRGLPPVLADLLIAQARHETGDYSSNAFTRHNNAFGYSYVPGAIWQRGPGLVSDNGQPVADYASIENSVGEIVDWIYRRVMEGKFPVNLDSITTPEQYAQLLKNAGFYTDTVDRYAAGMKRYYDPSPLLGNEAWILGGLAIAASLFLFFERKKSKRKRYKFG